MVYIWCILNMAMQVYTGCMPVVSYEAVSHMILRRTWCRGAEVLDGAPVRLNKTIIIYHINLFTYLSPRTYFSVDE